MKVLKEYMQVYLYPKIIKETNLIVSWTNMQRKASLSNEINHVPN